MMNLLKKLFKKRNISPRYTILTKALEKSKYKLSIKRAFYLGGFEYKEENYRATLNVLKKDLNSELANLKYNAKADNVELYMAESEDGNKYMIFLYDPVELYHNERILEIQQVNAIATPLSNQEQIYP